VFSDLGMPVDDTYGDLHLTVTIRPTKSEMDILRNNSPYFQGLFTLPDINKENMKVFTSKRLY
jgi:hypothetical protein